MHNVIVSMLFIVSLMTMVTSAQSENNLAETNTQKAQLTGMSREIYQAINALRADPKSLLPALEAMRATFKDKSYFDKDGKKHLTLEGVAAVDDAIAALKTQTSLPPIPLSEGLILAAEAHLKDLTTVDFFGHRGSDGSQPSERANRFGSAPYGVFENITGVSRTAREIIVQTLIDDGFPSRGHRKSLFNPELRGIGIAFGPSRSQGFISVIVFAKVFSERRSGPPEVLLPQLKTETKPAATTQKLAQVQAAKPATKPRTIVKRKPKKK